MSARVYKPKHPSYSRTWTKRCPVCDRFVRVNTDGTIAAHYPQMASVVYCPASREPYPNGGEE
jgi:hypothetical protein